MVQLEQGDTQSKTHNRITQCNSGQPLQEEPDPSNRVVLSPQIFKQISKL